MSDNLKKLTGKNPNDFQPIASSLINNCDVELFAELVENDDFLFDFVKQNVANRLEKVCNELNYLNLISFLKYYSPSYEDFICSILAKYADEDLTDKMLDIFENGTDDEKTYCAKFFSYIKDSLALDLLRKYSYSQNLSLASNCAQTLAAFEDVSSYNQALEKLNSVDDFERLEAVRFLCAYSNPDACAAILNAAKTSAMAENIAGEILYLVDWFSLYDLYKNDALFVLNLIINALGEICPLSCVLDFDLYSVFEYLFNIPLTSKIAVVLLNAKDKFDILTENNEYIYDETKDVKNEILDIKKLLNSFDMAECKRLIEDELDENSLFVYSAIDLSDNIEKIRTLLTSSNQTVVFKVLEVLKSKNLLTENDKLLATKSIHDVNLKSMLTAM